MSQMYLFEGIDVQKSKGDAAKTSMAEGVVLHYHGKPRKCSTFKHEHYHDGVPIDHWGAVDGSSLPAREVSDGEASSS